VLLDTKLCNAFLLAHPDDAARLVEQLPEPERARVLTACDPVAAARVLGAMAPLQAAETLARLDATTGATLVSHLALEVAASLLRRSPEPVKGGLLEAMDAQLARAIRKRLRYPEGTVGALMDPVVMALPGDLTAGEALEQARRFKLPVGYYLYVVDRQGRLVGVTNLRQLVHAEPGTAIASLMQTRVARLSASASREALSASPYWRDYHRLPVVDGRGNLVGMVRYETLRRIQDEVEGTGEAAGGIGTLMALGELYWMGLAGVLSGTPGGTGQSHAGRNGRGGREGGR
jgi:magnesium transporter